MRTDRIPALLLAAYLLLFVALGISPHDRAVWWAENIPIVALVGFLVVLYVRGVRASAMAYVLASALPILHTIGGYYTFERVPFDEVTRLFGFERNNYDRFGHFSVGLYAFGIAELLIARGLVARRWVGELFAVFCIGTIAALYEILEWIYAVTEGGSAGAAFLGSQGDVWDAQKDMLCDIAGACCAILLLRLRQARVISRRA